MMYGVTGWCGWWFGGGVDITYRKAKLIFIKARHMLASIYFLKKELCASISLMIICMSLSI